MGCSPWGREESDRTEAAEQSRYTHETILLVNITDIAITPPQQATDLLSVTADYFAFSKFI